MNFVNYEEPEQFRPYLDYQQRKNVDGGNRRSYLDLTKLDRPGCKCELFVSKDKQEFDRVQRSYYTKIRNTAEIIGIRLRTKTIENAHGEYGFLIIHDGFYRENDK